jgi:hypothetical protein
MNNWGICWLFTHIFTARRLYKSFGVKGLNTVTLQVGKGVKEKLQFLIDTVAQLILCTYASIKEGSLCMSNLVRPSLIVQSLTDLISLKDSHLCQDTKV